MFARTRAYNRGMNAVFAAIFILSGAVLLILDPAGFLPALLDGATKSATLCVALLASYAAWLGLMRLWEESGVARGISKILKPLCKKLFKTDDEEALSAIGMNLSTNLLGIGGAATPYGIRAATLLEKNKNAHYSSSMLFVVNATSLQLIPTSVVALRIAAGSAAAADIILPTMLATAFSTLLGVLLVKIFIRTGERKQKTKKREKKGFFPLKKQISRGRE